MSNLSPRIDALVAAHEAWNAKYGATVSVIGEGLLYATVCTSLADEALDAAMAELPATDTRGWTRSADEAFATGQPNPCPCEQDPEARRHVLYEA